MLEHLVTSRARRLLLMLLFGRNRASGTPGELAEMAGIALSNAQSELKAMRAAGWLTVTNDGAREVYAADPKHDEVEILEHLVAASERPRVAIRRVGKEEQTAYGHLRTLGAPLREWAAVPLGETTPLEALFASMPWARRDPTLARTVPICVWRSRDSFGAADLRALPAGPERRHALGFMIELAGELGGDRRLGGLAEALRDHRVTSLRPFFFDSERTTPFPLAEKWGFTMSTDLAAFASLFGKFVK